MSVAIRDANPSDAEAICEIYNHHVLKTIVTFEEVEVTVSEMAKRILDVAADFPWLVAERDRKVLGYAYATKWQERTAYRHSIQTTIYMEQASCGKGFGTELYSGLLDRLRNRPVHVALGGISLPNPASVALHEKCGFRKVAHFEQVGFKFGRWIDVGYWQILL
jgi:L-amino acid N-acyltransferase YncA